MTLKTAGSQTVTATDTVTGSINGTTAAITVNPAAAATLLVTPAGTTQTAGTSFNTTVVAKDAFGNTATGYLGTVHFTSTDGAATLPSNYTFVAGDSGSKTFSVTLNTTGSRTVTATDTVTATITGTTAAITVNAGAASTATSTISASPGSITANGSTTSTITVQLKDALGNNLAGSGGTVALATTSGSLGSVTDNANGTYTATLTSSTTAGTATVTGTLNAAAIASSAAVTFTAGPATKYLVTSSSYGPIAGSAVTITAQLADVNNNPVSTSGLTVTWSKTGAGGSFATGTSTTNGSGVATVSFTTSTTAGTVHTVTGNDGSHNGTSSNITTVPAGPTQYLVTSSSYSPVAGAAVTITAQLADANSNPVTTAGLTVTWSKTGAGGSFATGTSTTNASGIATVSFTTSTTAGTVHTVTGDDGSHSGTSSNITTVPGAATTLTVNGTPASVTAGTTGSVTVTAKDANGNVATGYTGIVHFTATDGAASLPSNYTFTGGDAGVHTFTNLYTLKTAGSQTLTATDTVTGSINGTSAGITVNPAAAATLTVNGTPASVTAGTTASVTVTAKDAFGNVATGYTGIAHFTSTDGAASLPANYTFVAGDAGVHTFSNAYTLKTVGSQTLTATDTVTATITGTSAGITVNPAAAATFAISGTPASVTAGNTGSVTVTALDAFGNTATGYTGIAHFTSTDGAASLPGNYTFVAGDSGVHTFTNLYTLKTAGSQTVTATDTVTATITGTSAGITVNPAAAATLTVNGTPASVTAGTTASVTVTAKDAFGNTATGYVGTAHFTSTDGAASLPANYTFVAGDAGVHTFSSSYTLKTVGSRTLTATDTVTATITGTSAGITVNPAGAATLTVNGTPASVTAGTTASVTVTAKDAFGNVATGYTGTVAFTSTDGAASLPANYTFTGGDAGVHTFSNAYTLKTVGSRTLTATDTVTGSITGTSAGITVNPAAASTLVLSATPASVTAGTTGSVTVTAKDAFGNVATGYTGTVAFTSTDGAASLPGNYAFVAGDSGVHTFTNLYTLKTAGSRTVTATDTVTGSINGTSAGITVNPAAAATFDVSAAASVTAGNSTSVTITARDAFGNVATGYVGTVHLTATDGAATLPANYTFVAGDNGTHVLAVTLKTAGSQTVTATDTVTATITGTTAAITVNPAAASTLVLSATPASVTAGTAASVTVTAKDAFGNVATGYTGIAHFTSTDGAASLPGNYTFTGGDAGVHTFTNAYTLKTAGSQTLTATDTVTGSINGTSASITVNPAAAATLSLTGTPASVVAGNSASVTITAKDAFGNVATGYTGTVHVTSTDGAAALPGNYTFVAGDAGVHTLAATLKTVGSQTLTATDTVTGSINGTSPSITVNPAAAATLTLSATPASVTAGTAASVTVTAKDAFGNTATGYIGTVHFTSTDGAASLPANYTFVGGDTGVHTFTNGYTLQTTGSRTLTATDTVTATITGTSASITVNPATATTLVLSATPASVTAGTAASVTVTAKDAFGNVATGYTGIVHFTSTDGAASLPGNYTFTGGDTGVHTFTNAYTLKTAGSQTLTATDTVTGSINGTSASITVNPAAAVSFQVTAPGSATAGSSSSVTVTAKDAFGNVVTGYVGTVHFTSTDGSATLPANYTFVAGDAGSHVFSATLKTAGSQTITATDTVTSSITGTSAAVSVSPAATSTLVLSGNPASVTAGTPASVTVTAEDAFGNTTPAYTGIVHFTSTDGAATLPANYTFVGGDAGTHTFTNGVTLVTVGSRTVTATDTVTGSINGTTSAITVNPAGAATLSLTGTPASVTAGGSASVTVTAKDAFGNVATGYTGTIHFTSTDGAAVLPGDYTFVGGDNGVHAFSATLKTVGSRTLTATDTGTGSITGTSAVIAVNPAAASTLVLSATPASVTAGAAASVTVTAKDAFGNVATGYLGTVHFTSTDGAATLPANYAFVAGDSGVHTFSSAYTLVTVGSRTVTATDTVTGSINGTSAPITVNPAGASVLTLTATPASVTAGTTGSVTVTAKDAFGNVDTNYTGTVHFTSTDGGATLPANYAFAAGDNGVHTFSNAYTLKTAGSRTLTATDTVTATITGTSAAITVNPAAAATLSLTGTPASVTAGGSASVTVTAKDAFGNVATGYTGIAHFTSTDGAAVLPGDYTFVAGDSGTHAFSATLKTAGSQTLTATDTVTGSINGTSAVIGVNPAAATILSLTGTPASVTAGTPASVTVTAKDAFGNVATGYTGTVHFTSTDGAATLPANYTFTGGDAGVHAFSATLQTTGSRTVTATDTVTATITGTSAAITVNPAAATSFSLTGTPASVTAGGSAAVTVTAKDAFGNIATGYVGTVHFTSTDGIATLPANYTFVAGDNGAHAFSTTLKTAGSQTITATDTVTSSTNGTSPSVTVNAGAVSGAVSTAVASPTSVPADGSTTSTITVTLTDAFGNPRAGKTVTLAQTGASTISPASGPSTAAGVVTFTVKDATAQTVTYTATDTTDSVTLTQTPAVAYAIGSLDHIVVSPSSATVSAGVSQSYTVEAFDATNNSLGDVTAGSSFGITPDGSCTGASCSASVIGAHTVTATYAGKTSNSTLTVISAPADPAASTISAAPGSITANGVTTSTVTVQLKDIFGNNRTSGGNIVGLSTTAGSLSAVTDNGNGTYTATLTSATTVGTATITGTLDAVAIVSTATVTFTPGAATHYTLTGAASTTAGVAASVTVTARDAFGNVATGYTGTAHFTSTDGAATLPANYAFVAGDNGAHTFSVTLKTAGSKTVTATDTVTATITGSKAITVNPAAATTFTVTSSGGSETAGTGFTVTVTAKDAFGNVDTNYTGTVHFTSTDGGATLPADYTFVGGDAGAHTFPATLTTVGSQTITATQGAVTGTTPAITVVPGAVASFTLTGVPASVVSGVPASVTVTAKDAFANIVTGYVGIVHFSSNDPAASLPGDYTFTGGDAGVHTFTNGYTLFTTGARTVTASDTVSPAVTGTSPFISVTPGAASGATSTIAASPISILANGVTTSTITVTLKDVTGNLLTAGGNAVALATTSGTLSAVTDNGNGTYTATLTSSTVAGVASVSGTVDLAPIAIGTTVTFHPGPATSFDVTGPATATAGTAGSYTVTARDAFGNVATGYVGTAHFTSSDSQALLPANYTFTGGDAGVHVFAAITLKTAGTQTVTATDTVTATITGTSAGVAVSGLGVDANVSTVTASPAAVIADGSATTTITVTLKDLYGNPVAGKTVTVAHTGSASVSSGGSGTSDGAGVATFTATDATPETVTFSSVGDSVTLTQQAAVNYTTGVLDHIVISPPSSTISSDGGSQTYTVTGFDATNHSLGDFTSGSTFTITPDGSCVNATATCSATTAGVHTVTAHNSGFTSTSTLTVTAGVPSTLTSTITSSPASVIADNTLSTITVRLKDAAGNNVPTSGGTVALSTTLGTLSAVTDNLNGTYTATVKSTVAGTASITGTLNAAALASSTTVLFVPGPATQFVVTSPASATAGTATTVTVTAKDQYGNTATGYLGTVHFTSSDGSATLPANYTFTGADNGVNTFPATLKTAGSQTITATDTVTASINGTTGTIGVNPGAVSGTTSTVTASPAAVPADNATTSAVNVTLKDAFGNVVPGKTVTLGAGGGSSSWTPLTDITNGSGIASFAVKDATVENVVYNATDTSDALPLTDTATVNFTAGPLASITINPSTATVAAGVGQTYTVRGYDAFGHDLGDVTPATALTINPNGSCVGATCTATIAGPHTVIATNAGHTTTSSLTVTPAAASVATSTVTATPGTITANGTSTSTITVQLKDAFNNNLATSAGIVTLATTNGSITATATDNSNGTYTGTLTSAASPGSATVSAKLAGTPLTSTATVNFSAILPGPASGATSTISASPGTIIANGTSTSTITVQLKDAAGLNLTTGGDDVELTTTGGTLVPLAPAHATDNGNGTYTAILTSPASAGSGTVSGTVNGSAITDTAVVTFSAGPPGPASGATSTITAAPLTIVGDGTTHSTITVQLKDAAGTNLGAGGDTVALATTSGTLSAVTDNADGTYTATLTSPVGAGSATISGTVNAAAITSTASVTFTAPGSPPALVNATVTGSTLVLTYDQTLDGTSIPSLTDFVVHQNLIVQGTPTGISISGTTVTISLAAPVNPGDVVTLDYTGNLIKNLAAMPAPTFTGQPVTVGGVTPPSPITCTPPQVPNAAGTACITPRPPPPPIQFLGTTPADGAILGSVGSITFNASHDTSWYAITVTLNGVPQDVAPGSGASYTAPFTATAPGTYTISATLDDGYNPRQYIHVQFTIVDSGIPGIGVPNAGGSVNAGDGIGSASWGPGTFPDPVIVRMDPIQNTAGVVVPPGSPAYQVTATRLRDGSPVHNLGGVIDVQFKNAPLDGVASTSEDGSTWGPVPALTSLSLPDGQVDGWFRDSNNTVHILTRHLTYFGLLVPSNTTKLSFQVYGTVRYTWGVDKYVGARISLTQAALVTGRLYSSKGRKLKTWVRPARAGNSILKLKLPNSARKPGMYTIRFTARAKAGATAKQSIRVRVLPTLKIALTRKTQGRSVVLAASAGSAIAANLHGLRTNVVSGDADATFRATGNSSVNVVVLVVDADQLGISTIRELHAIYPDVRILALSRLASVRGMAVPAGATVALPTGTSPAQLAKTIARLAA